MPTKKGNPIDAKITATNPTKVRNGRWLAGLLDARGTIDVRRVRQADRCFIEPRLMFGFDVERSKIAKELASLIDGSIAPYPKRPERITAYAQGFRKLAKVAKTATPHIRDDPKRCRLETIAERAKKPNPSKCTKEEAQAPEGKLADIVYRNCPPLLREE